MATDRNGAEIETNYKVDVDQGAMIRFDRETGAAVYMMYAKPGVYLNDHGRVVPELFAQRAGFDIELYGKMRRKQEAIGKATAAIEEQFKLGLAKKVILECGEYRLVDVGHEMYVVEFDDGTPMGRPTNKDVGLSTFRILSGYAGPDDPEVADEHE